MSLPAPYAGTRASPASLSGAQRSRRGGAWQSQVTNKHEIASSVSIRRTNTTYSTSVLLAMTYEKESDYVARRWLVYVYALGR